MCIELYNNLVMQSSLTLVTLSTVDSVHKCFEKKFYLGTTSISMMFLVDEG